MKEQILKELKTEWAGHTCHYFETLNSTNDYAKSLLKEGACHGTLVVADCQTGGKGRRGRVWETPKGTNISMSLCLEPQLPAEKVSGLTLVAALAVARAIRETAGTEAGIKWPNDLVLNGKKICGILTEMIFHEGRYGVVVGIGINVNNESFPESIESIAGSLKSETGKAFSREALIAIILRYFEEAYEIYVQTGNMVKLKETYENFLINKEKEVCVLDPKEPYRGTALGINEDGNLRVLCADGSVKEVWSGEVSVRGLYGYV